MRILIAGGTGAIGRPLVAELLAKGHALVALTRSPEKAQALVKQGIEPAIADVFNPDDAIKAVVLRTQPEVVIEQLTALLKTYTRQSMNAAAALNNRIRLEGGANVLAAAQAAGVRRYLRQSVAFYAIPGAGLADEHVPLAFDVSPAVAAGAREVQVVPVQANFCYRTAFGGQTPVAYQTLLLDAMRGDQTLFTRGDEIKHGAPIAQRRPPSPERAVGIGITINNIAPGSGAVAAQAPSFPARLSPERVGETTSHPAARSSGTYQSPASMCLVCYHFEPRATPRIDHRLDSGGRASPWRSDANRH